MRHLLLILVSVALSACTATMPSTQDRPVTPKPPSATERSANAWTPAGSMPRTIAEPSIRVGLLIDQPKVTFPRTAGGYYLVTERGPSTLRRGFTISAPLAEATVRYAVQMAAISDQTSAQALAEKVRSETGLRVDRTFDPANGMFKILAGDFATSEEAAPTRAQLVERGYGRDLLVVRRPSDQKFEKRMQLVDDEGDSAVIEAGSLAIFPITADTLSIDNKPYRTSARLFVNARGLLNVINELGLEDYLLGVVPAEMGPSIYDELEALKAQAVAARTYAIKNMRQFESEGYDICPGPACQAYKGFGGEHDLSTRAVRETSGLVMTYQGQLIDSLYSATCGGETSDAGTMFPGRNEPYLKAARCVELELLTFAGRADSGLLQETQLNARLFAALASLPESRSWAAGDVARAVVAAMTVAGFRDLPAATPASSRRRDVLTYLSTMMKLESKSRVVTLPEDRAYFFPQSGNLETTPYVAAAFLVKYGIWPAQFIDRVRLDEAMPREELYAFLGSWLREQNFMRDVQGRVFRIEGRRVTLKEKGETTPYTLPAAIPIFRRLGDRYQEYARVPVMIGDRATAILGPGNRVAAFVVQANYDGAAFDRTSSFSNWTRSYRADELVASINRRNPIRELLDIKPLVIDASERVAELEVTAEGGRTFVLRGLPVRWSLNLPDNLFVYDKTRDADGMDRYTFYGKGWGHGTGMCQVGAFGMAFRGWTYDRILRNFYTGIEIVRTAAK